MKNILILLSLIYFISCSKKTCNLITEAQSPKDCFSASVNDKNNHCCFIQVRDNKFLGHQSAKVCYEYNKRIPIDEIRKALDSQYKLDNQVLEDFRC